MYVYGAMSYSLPNFCLSLLTFFHSKSFQPSWIDPGKWLTFWYLFNSRMSSHLVYPVHTTLNPLAVTSWKPPFFKEFTTAL